MSTIYADFIEGFAKIDPNKKDSRIDYVLGFLHKLGNAKRYEEFQSILNEIKWADLNDECIVTVAMVSWWFGDHLDRKAFIENAMAYFNTFKTEAETERIFQGFKNKSWKPTFGFERELFDLPE
jgi:hypothetical protein